MFPRAVLANVARKIGRRTQTIDIPVARRAFGLTEGVEPVTLGSEEVLDMGRTEATDPMHEA